MDQRYNLRNNYEYNRDNQAYLKKICSVISSIGFDTFFYTKVYLKDGYIFSLCTHTDWAEYFWDNQILYTNSFLKALSSALYNKNYILLNPNILNANKFNVYNMISNFDLVEEEYIENWGFASSNPEINVNEIYFNNKHLFRKFLFYFKYTAKNIIQNGEKHKIFYLNKNLIQVLTLNRCDNINILKNLKFNKWYINNNLQNYYLTTRQKECLVHLVNGLTIKEISKALDISAKTVEFHIQRIKVKTGCQYKANLIQLARSNFMK